MQGLYIIYNRLFDQRYDTSKYTHVVVKTLYCYGILLLIELSENNFLKLLMTNYLVSPIWLLEIFNIQFYESVSTE